MAMDWQPKTTPPSGNGVRSAAVGKTNISRRERSSNPDLDGRQIVRRRHIDWIEHHVRWRWLLDSFEGGDRYRNAIYGPDRRGLPTRNMFRHKREYPDPQMFPAALPASSDFNGYAAFVAPVSGFPTGDGQVPMPGTLGSDPGSTAQDDDYEYRRSRTPVPEFVAEAVEAHLSKIYDQEVRRDGPDDLVGWWRDVDGRGTPVDDWMRETVAPLLLVLGCLDVCLDHPQAPPGAEIHTRADELRLGLDCCVASYILPQNMVWWRLDAAGRYLECLVREFVDPSDRMDHDDNGNAVDPNAPDGLGEAWRRDYVRWRLWRTNESILFSYDGEVIERVTHRFGCVPIIRLVDLPKHRTRHIGKSRYEGIAEYQREFYNRDSELILSDTLQAHPFLSGAEDYCKSDNTLSIGPGYILPMKKSADGQNYQGWEFVSPSKDPAESLRKNKQDIIDMTDRLACLSKPAGTSTGSTTSQSGISKQLDAVTGHKLLVSIAKSLAKAERQLAEYALIVLRNSPLSRELREQVRVIYPARFELFAASELTGNLLELQKALAGTGEAPELECEILQAIIRQTLLGLSDADYARLDNEIDRMVASKSHLAEKPVAIGPQGISSGVEVMEGDGSAEQAGGVDPLGESDATMLGTAFPGDL